MLRSRLAPVLLVVGLLSACSSSTPPPVAAPSAAGEMTAPNDAIHGGTAVRAPLAFGATSTDPHGLAVTVAAPRERALPTGARPVQEWPHYVGVTVTVVNGGSTAYDPQSLFVSLTSGDRTAEQVFGAGAGGAPAAEVAPGGSISFPLAFGVDDPAALTLEIAPDFSEPTVVYQG